MRKIVIETPVKLPGTNIMLEEGDSIVIHTSNVMKEGGGAGVTFGFPEFNLESKIFIPIKNGKQFGFKPVGFSGEAILSSYQDTRSTTDTCSRREKLGDVLSVDILYHIEDYMKNNRVDYSMAQIQGVRIDEIRPKEYVHGGGYRRADFPETMSMEASIECTVIDYDGTHLDTFFDIETEVSIEFGYADCVKYTYMDLDSGESYDESKTVTKESVSVLLDKGDQKVFQAFLKKLRLNSFDDYSEIDHGNELSYIFTDDDWYQLIQPNRDEFLRNSKHGFKKVVEARLKEKSSMANKTFDLLLDYQESNEIPEAIKQLYFDIISERIKPTHKGLNEFALRIQAFKDNQLVRSLTSDITHILSGGARKDYRLSYDGSIYGPKVSATSELFDLFRQGINYDNKIEESVWGSSVLEDVERMSLFGAAESISNDIHELSMKIHRNFGEDKRSLINTITGMNKAWRDEVALPVSKIPNAYKIESTLSEAVDIKKIIKDLQGDFGGDNTKQLAGVQLLKGLSTSDDVLANKFMKALNTAMTKVSKEVLGENGK